MIIRSKVKVNLFVLCYSICVILFFLVDEQSNGGFDGQQSFGDLDQ